MTSNANKHAQGEKVLKRITARTSVIYLFNITNIFNINLFFKYYPRPSTLVMLPVTLDKNLHATKSIWILKRWICISLDGMTSGLCYLKNWILKIISTTFAYYGFPYLCDSYTLA